MDIYETIRQDHDEARGLLDLVAATPKTDAESLAEAFGRLKRHLWIQHRVEEAVFYAALDHCEGIDAEAVQGVHAHNLANGLLETMDAEPVGNAAWFAHLRELDAAVRAHMDQEETAVFTEARRHFSDDDAALLGRSMATRLCLAKEVLEPSESLVAELDGTDGAAGDHRVVELGPC